MIGLTKHTLRYSALSGLLAVAALALFIASCTRDDPTPQITTIPTPTASPTHLATTAPTPPHQLPRLHLRLNLCLPLRQSPYPRRYRHQRLSHSQVEPFRPLQPQPHFRAQHLSPLRRLRLNPIQTETSSSSSTKKLTGPTGPSTPIGSATRASTTGTA